MKWEEYKIKELGRVVTGKTPSTSQREFFGGNYLFVTPSDLNFNHYFVRNTNTTISEVGKEKHENQFLPPNSIMFTCIGNTIGKIAINQETCLTNQQINSIIPFGSFNYKFIYYSLINRIPEIRILGGGVATPIINKSTFEEVKLNIPPLPIQQKIASILSAYDDLIENNLKRIRLLEEAAQHLYQEWFVRFRFPGWEEAEFGTDGLPVGWERVNLYEFANLKMGYPFKAEDFNEEKNGTPVIRIRDIPNHWTNTYSKSSTSDDYWVEKNDIVIGMDGFFYTDVWGGQRGYLVQRVCRIRPNDERLNGYLLEAIKGPINYFERTISGATVAHLGAKHLKEIEIIKPPEKFIPELEVLNNILMQKVNLLGQNQKLKDARDILLPRLMDQTIQV